MHRPRLAARRDLHRAHEVEPQAYEVDEVVARQRLAAKMRVNEAKATEASLGRAEASDVREHEAPRVTDDDVIDLTRSMDERADLTSRLDARFHERADELGRGDVRDGDAAPVDALQRLRGRRGET
jgi:hypothetical protein